MTSIPPTMQAWTYSAQGSHRQVLKLTTIPSPKSPTGDEVLIKIAYTGLNPGDSKLMGLLPTFFRAKNSIPGTDFSGTIVARGAAASADLGIGEKVFGMIDRDALLTGGGTLCEYICLSPTKAMVARVPANVSLEEASALGTAGVVAFGVCKHGAIPAGNNYRVLVNGASGGCGTMFVQAVLAMGAKEVVGICSASNADIVRSLGASRTIDYRASVPLHETLAKEYGQSDRKFDFILDTVGAQALYTNSPRYLKEGGVFVNIGDYTNGTLLTAFHWFLNSWWPTWLWGTPRKFVMFSADVDPDSVEWLLKFAGERKMKAVIERVYGFEEALDAFDLLITKRVRGRIVVKVAKE